MRRMYIRDGRKLVPTRQRDRSGGAARRVVHETGRDQRLRNDFYSSAFPSPARDACGLRGVADVFREQPFQMAFIQPDNVIQPIAPAAFDPTLRHTILPGTLEGGPYRAHLQRSNGYGNLQPVLCVPVED